MGQLSLELLSADASQVYVLKYVPRPAAVLHFTEAALASQFGHGFPRLKEGPSQVPVYCDTVVSTHGQSSCLPLLRLQGLSGRGQQTDDSVAKGQAKHRHRFPKELCKAAKAHRARECLVSSGLRSGSFLKTLDRITVH